MSRFEMCRAAECISVFAVSTRGLLFRCAHSMTYALSCRIGVADSVALPGGTGCFGAGLPVGDRRCRSRSGPGSVSAKAASELRASLIRDWDVIQEQLVILSAEDEKSCDPRLLLDKQGWMVNKIERLTAALMRYANLAYGG